MPCVADAAAPVLVFNLGPNPIQHGILGVIRTLGRLGIDVYALVIDRLVPAAASRYARRSFVWSQGTRDAEQLGAILLKIGRDIGRRTVLIPTDDRGAAFVAEHADVLEQSFVFAHSPRCQPRQLSNKRQLYALCGALGIPCPAATFPRSPDDVAAFVERARFPVVVKAADAGHLRNGARSTSIAHTAAQLLATCRQVAHFGEDNVILQEYIPDAVGEDWIFHGYANPRTGCSIAFTGRKLRSYPVCAGPTTLGLPVANDTLIQQTRRLIDAIGYAGIMDLDYRLDRRDGEYKLLDFNPRTGANFRMFENGAGIDVVRASYLDLTGQPVPQSSVVKARTFVDESHDLAAGVGYVRNHGLTLRQWWQSMAGTKELAWFCREDPLPALVMGVRLLSRVLARGIRTASLRLKDRAVRLRPAPPLRRADAPSPRTVTRVAAPRTTPPNSSERRPSRA